MIKSKWEHIIHKSWILKVFLAIFAVMASKIITGIIFLLLVNVSNDVCRLLYSLYSCMADIFIISVINLWCNKQKASLSTINKRDLIGYIKGIFYGIILVLLVVMPMFLFLTVEIEINNGVSIIIIFLLLLEYILFGILF